MIIRKSKIAKQITVFEIRLKVFLLKDIPLSKMLTAEAYFIDSVLTKDQEWLTYHETNNTSYIV